MYISDFGKHVQIELKWWVDQLINTKLIINYVNDWSMV